MTKEQLNQDFAGVQGHKIADGGDTEVWAKPTSDGGAAVVLFNRGEAGAQVATSAADLGLPASDAYTMRDLWQNTTEVTTGPVRASVPAHGARMFVVAPGSDGVPAVSADVRTDGYVGPGESFAANATVFNDGLGSIGIVWVSLTAPDGWTVEPASGTIEEIPAGQSATVEFTVAVPAGAATGGYPLTAGVTMSGTGFSAYGGVRVATAPTGTPYVSDLDAVSVQVGWGELGVDESVDGNPLTIAGVRYDKGIAPHAASEVTYYLGTGCTRFTAKAGVDDETGGLGTVGFTVLGDGAVLAETGVLRGGDPAAAIDVDVTGVTELRLLADVGGDGNQYDHADWVDPQLTCDAH